MSTGLLALLGLLPIAVIFFLMVGINKPGKIAMPIAWGTAVLLSMSVWKTDFIHISASTMNGVLGSLNVLSIVGGALLIMNVLTYSGAMNVIRKGGTYTGL